VRQATLRYRYARTIEFDRTGFRCERPATESRRCIEKGRGRIGRNLRGNLEPIGNHPDSFQLGLRFCDGRGSGPDPNVASGMIHARLSVIAVAYSGNSQNDRFRHPARRIGIATVSSFLQRSPDLTLGCALIVIPLFDFLSNPPAPHNTTTPCSASVGFSCEASRSVY
jgi:hypothetical protein